MENRNRGHRVAFNYIFYKMDSAAALRRMASFIDEKEAEGYSVESVDISRDFNSSERSFVSQITFKDRRWYV